MKQPQGSTSTSPSPSRRRVSARNSGANELPVPSLPVAPDFPQTAATSFTSSLDIAVEGAVSIDSEGNIDEKPSATATQAPAQLARESSKRAPRKSKTDALAALSTRSRPSSPETDDIAVGDLAPRHPIPTSTTFNVASVKTKETRGNSQDDNPRLFGLEHCPAFFPTPEEFKDPMAYIKSISATAREYGICKIVPPNNWNMPFVTETETFRFRTRLQRLNSIEASSRAKFNFLEQLYQFHHQQGNSHIAVPTINHKYLDLWLLRKEVQSLGGYEAVTKHRKWSDIGRLLGYGAIPGLSTQLKISYQRIIQPYEDFCERSKASPTNAKTHSAPNSAATSTTKVADNSIPSSPLTDTSDEVESPKKTPSTSKPNPPTTQDSDEETNDREQPCEICLRKNRGTEMLLCDGCDCGYHMFCLDPPLDKVPRDEWFCYTCLAGTGGDYGFDEGDEHSLNSFQARDLEFRRRWFKSHPPQRKHNADEPFVTHVAGVSVSEYDVEQEFWRLVQSPTETVEVEYGADVHSTTHGSAMPTTETHPLDPYSQDPWNLNNIPIVSDSLLRYIKSDISGMTVPWTYVGMTFSTFCWHSEDHYTYSINFMHWGETKTWYGIPGADAEKFEAAIKSEAPDLFEAQPDLLFQLVTLMNPQRIVEAGVRVYGCNQRAGEFVITFPKAYHAGFNHGFNFNEAVNFALPDWLPMGLDCVRRYREHRKAPVFSHDELLISITQHSQSISTAVWLLDDLKEMTEREMSQRQVARSRGYDEVLEERDRPEDQYQCFLCKTFCYLSHIICPCGGKVACIDHADQLCERHKSKLVLRKRFTDEDILATQSKVDDRADIPAAWRTKFLNLLKESKQPNLRDLRALLVEGERISRSMPELASLRKCVSRGNDWVENATAFLSRKPSRKRLRRSRGRATAAEVIQEEFERPERTLLDLRTLLDEHQNLGFECPEYSSLQSLAAQAENVKHSASALLTKITQSDDTSVVLTDCENVLQSSSFLNVYIEEVGQIEKFILRAHLLQELANAPQNCSADEIRVYIARAQTCDLPMDNPLLEDLQNRLRNGDELQDRASSILAKPFKTMEELDAFAALDRSAHVDPGLADRVLALRAKAKEHDNMASQWLSQSKTTRPTVAEAKKLVERAEREFIIPSVLDVKAVVGIAEELEERCDQVLNLRYKEGNAVFDHIQKWTEYADQHLSIFELPNKKELQQQVYLHTKWYKDLPWYCTAHEKTHPEPVLEDVLEVTKFDDDAPPSDEYFTCICNDAVRPPPPGRQSDAVQCDHCFARFHGRCAMNGGSCPFCDQGHWDGSIPSKRPYHFCTLPTLLVDAPDITRFYSDDWKNLEIIVHRVDRLSAVIGQFLSFTSTAVNQRPEYIPQVRHYMRKLFRLQFAVSPTTDVSYGHDLSHLHRALANLTPALQARRRRRSLKFTFGQDVDRDWVNGTRCICRGRVPYLRDYPTVQCMHCHRKYHCACVFYPEHKGDGPKYSCPLCCLRKNERYRYADIRVTHSVVGPPGLNTYINIEEMMEAGTKELFTKTLPPPVSQTLFVELVQVTCDDEASTQHSQPLPPPPIPRKASPINGTPSAPPAVTHLPQPPWHRWATPTVPQHHRSRDVEELHSENHRNSQEIVRKRKYSEGHAAVEDSGLSAKRRPVSSTYIHTSPASHNSRSPPSAPHPIQPVQHSQSLSPPMRRVIVGETGVVPSHPRTASFSNGRHA